MGIMFKSIDTEEKRVTELYECLKSAIEQLHKKADGCRISSNLDKKILLKVFIKAQNDGFFVDEENNVIIWDKKIAASYNEQITSTCRRVCGKKEKGTCPGCAEYLSLAELNAYFVTEEIVLNVA